MIVQTGAVVTIIKRLNNDAADGKDAAPPHVSSVAAGAVMLLSISVLSALWSPLVTLQVSYAMSTERLDCDAPGIAFAAYTANWNLDRKAFLLARPAFKVMGLF